jgi:hypothetical protein
VICGGERQNACICHTIGTLVDLGGVLLGKDARMRGTTPSGIVSKSRRQNTKAVTRALNGGSVEVDLLKLG